MADVIIYTKTYDPYSKECKEMLDKKGVKYSEKIIDQDPMFAVEMEQKSGGRTDTPQIFINEHHIGSGDDLKALDSQGELDKLLFS